MGEYLVNCINKLEGDGGHADITHIGNLEDHWRMSVAGAIYQIDNNISRFYTLDATGHKRCYLEVVRELHRPPFLRAHLGGRWSDALIELQECFEETLVVA